VLGKYIEAAKVRIFVWIVEYARDMLLSPLAGFERKNGELMKNAGGILCCRSSFNSS
jgi:hypothetical protein